MNDEIKEILESLDKIAKAEYYPEDLLTYKECQLLLDYITNLQKENRKIRKSLEKYMKEAITLRFTEVECGIYRQRIDKAIEYIEEKTIHYTSYLPPVPKKVPKLELQREAYDKLLNILKGGDEE